MRTSVGLMVLLCVGGLVLAQDKDKKKEKEDKGTPMILVKVDVKGMTLTLKPSEKGKETVYKATKDTKFVGPRGGKHEIDHEALKPGAKVSVVLDDKTKTLKEVHLPYRDSKLSKDKDKKEK